MADNDIRFVQTNMRGKRNARVFYAMIGNQVVGHYLGWFTGNVVQLYRVDGEDGWCPLRVNIAPEEVARA